MGIEPTTASLEGWDSTTELRPPGFIHKLNSTHWHHCSHAASSFQVGPACCGGQARIRTLEDISQQIYSLPPLATWVPAQKHSTWSMQSNNHQSLLSFSAERRVGSSTHNSTSPPKRRKVMSCGDSLVQETLDSIDEVSRCQALNFHIAKFFFPRHQGIQISAPTAKKTSANTAPSRR